MRMKKNRVRRRLLGKQRNHLPLARIDEGGGDLAKKKERPLIIYDDGGERSAKAAAALKRQGFTRVANLTGGLDAWRQAGLPVEK